MIRRAKMYYESVSRPFVADAEDMRRRADHLEWAANALEAVLNEMPTGIATASGWRGPAWLEAALTRATATTEGAK